MNYLPRTEKSLPTCTTVLRQYQRVTDGRTDGQQFPTSVSPLASQPVWWRLTVKLNQWLKWFCEAEGAHLTQPGWSKSHTHSNPLIWRYLGIK